MLQGILVDLVPYDKRFLDREAEWLNGPMGEWWGQDGLKSQAMVQQRRERFHEQLGGGGTYVRFGVQTKSGLPIGVWVLAQISAHRRLAEVGAGIGDPTYWGGGYGSDAMLLITEYAFHWLDLRRLWLTTAGTNFRAQRQVEKCGFTREAVYRSAIRSKRGEAIDFLSYGLMRDEWPGREAMVERLGLAQKAALDGSRP